MRLYTDTLARLRRHCGGRERKRRCVHGDCAAHLVGPRKQAANLVVTVGVHWVEVEAEHQVTALHHDQLVALILGAGSA